MCGIAGIFAYHYLAPKVDLGEVNGIRDSMTVRGPDGRGEWMSKDGRVAIGHRRLSIIEVSSLGAQPMVTGPDDLVISFNGEIYNYREIKADLLKKGYSFRSNSDTEVLLKLYQEKGLDMVHDLRGMFAFMIWDNKKQALFLARDAYGIKPLYYADDGWTVRIASQVKALLSSPKVSKLPDPSGIVGYFLFGSVPEPNTLYQEIKALPAGCTLWIDAAGPAEPKPFFCLSAVLKNAEQKSDLATPEKKSKVHEAILESIKYHYVSDVPVGVFLSAGKDSSTLVALSKELRIEKLKTVTLSFREFQGMHEDEAPLAQLISQQYGTEHHVSTVTAMDFKKELSQYLNAMDQPSIDAVNTYFVSKAAKEAGLKVALSGVGADELFGGYPSFSQIPKLVQFLKVPALGPFVGDIFRASYASTSRFVHSLKPKYAGLLKYGGSYEGAYFLRRGLFMPWELSSLIPEDLAHEGLRRMNIEKYIRSQMNPDPDTPFKRVCALESSLFLRNQLLRDADWAGMHYSLEIRTPFVDASLLKKIAPLMDSKGSSLNKDMMAQTPINKLPDEVLNRPKSGFSVPMDSWLELASVDEWKKKPLLSKQSCHWSRKWAYSLYKKAFA